MRKRINKRRTNDDRSLGKERKEGRRKNKPKKRKEIEKKREQVSKRRIEYENKLPYERWEAAVRWKDRRKDPNTRRRQENQEGRRPWLKGIMEEHEERIRHYERKPREYTDREGTKEKEEKGKGKGRKGRSVGEEWGRWKTYREGETDQILVWKKGILSKKGLSKGKGSEWRAWERGRYYKEYGKRRTRHENRRRIRRSNYNLPKKYKEVVDKGGRNERKGRESPWRRRGLETRKNTNEPKVWGEPMDKGKREWRHQAQRYTEIVGNEVEANFSYTIKVNYEERKERKAWKKRKWGNRKKKSLRWSSRKERIRIERRNAKRDNNEPYEWKGEVERVTSKMVNRLIIMGKEKRNEERKRRMGSKRKEPSEPKWIRKKPKKKVVKKKKKKGTKGVGAGVVDWARLENEKSGMTRRFESYPTRRKRWWQSG